MTNPYQQSQQSQHGAAASNFPRSTSYASIVSGSQQQQQQSATRSSALGFSHILDPNPDAELDTHNPYYPELDRLFSRPNIPTFGGAGMDMDTGYTSRNQNENGHNNNNTNSGPWPPPARLGSNFSMSRAFDMFLNKEPLSFADAADVDSAAHKGTGAGANPFLSGGTAPNFLAPSYLRGTTYLTKLEEQHRARILAEREREASVPGAKTQTRAGVLATNGNSHHTLSPMSGKVHTGGGSHRGVAFDVVEKSALSQGLVEEEVNPLPSRWNMDDREPSLELSGDGYEVTFTGRMSNEHEASAVRADHPMNPACGIYYFEITVLNKKKSSTDDMPPIAIGFSSQMAALNRAPGWEPESWGYHGDDGNCFAAQNVGKAYGPKFGPKDTVGCCINFRLGQAFFTKNGKELKVAFRDINFKDVKAGKLFPMVGLKKTGDHIWANFGQQPFMFDIDNYMLEQQQIIEDEINRVDTRILAPGLSETELIQQLVLQFLQHDGYVETARAFAEEIHSEKSALRLSAKEQVKGINIKDDEDANNRQRIRRAILEGDIDRAMRYTEQYYPNVLKENEQVYFRLKCRKFIEMIRKEAEMNLKLEDRNRRLEEQRSRQGLGDNDEEMQDEWDDEREFYIDQLGKLSMEALEYGQELRAEFTNNPSREMTKHLDEISSLIAYPHPLQVPEVSHLMDAKGRVAVAEELNSAILTSLGKSSRAALENVYAQTSVLLEDLAKDGGPGAFVTLEALFRQFPPSKLL
uniref:Uncharacterized protein n=2 Tax=Podospora anserina (strain S / ATCC MYA-4624 / DSM 980 / FGSC 10383) TaxID=515849 RepID=A0A090CHJ8_PODAN|nr:Putative protein similar to ran-binding protein 10 RBP10 of Mus musculus [Podospora anserina S mat+]